MRKEDGERRMDMEVAVGMGSRSRCRCAERDGNADGERSQSGSRRGETVGTFRARLRVYKEGTIHRDVVGLEGAREGGQSSREGPQ